MQPLLTLVAVLVLMLVSAALAMLVARNANHANLRASQRLRRLSAVLAVVATSLVLALSLAIVSPDLRYFLNAGAGCCGGHGRTEIFYGEGIFKPPPSPTASATPRLRTPTPTISISPTPVPSTTPPTTALYRGLTFPTYMSPLSTDTVQLLVTTTGTLLLSQASPVASIVSEFGLMEVPSAGTLSQYQDIFVEATTSGGDKVVNWALSGLPRRSLLAGTGPGLRYVDVVLFTWYVTALVQGQDTTGIELKVFTLVRGGTTPTLFSDSSLLEAPLIQMAPGINVVTPASPGTGISPLRGVALLIASLLGVLAFLYFAAQAISAFHGAFKAIAELGAVSQRLRRRGRRQPPAEPVPTGKKTTESTSPGPE